MLDEQIMSVGDFRKITKKQGFASDTFSDEEVENYIYLLDCIAELALREEKTTIFERLKKFQISPETTTRLEQQVQI